MPKRLKILVFVDNFAPPTETFVYDHARRISAAHDLLLVCINRWNTDLFPFTAVKQLSYPQSKIRKIIRARMYRHHLLLDYHNPKFQDQISELLRSFQPDLIHCHFGNKALMLLDNLDAQLFQGPVFITFYGYDASELLKRRPAYRRRIRQVLQRPYIFPIMVSRHLLHNLRAHRIENERSRVLHLGTDTDFFKPWPRSENTVFTFVQIAGFRKKKGHRYTIAAFARLQSQFPDFPCQLIFGGSGELEEEMKQLAIELKVDHCIEFRAWVDKEQARELLNQADAFLYFSVTPSNGDQEGLPVAITEAMAMELPVCATIHSGIPEVVEHGRNGLLVDEKDIQGYVSAMKEIAEWGRQTHNRTKIIEHFSHQSYLDRDLMQYYEDALTAPL